MKKDGHTHTEFCPHGSGEEVELFIQKAIELGFTEYSITEHNPLPQSFMEQVSGEPEAISTGGMNAGDVETYLKKMQNLKEKYKSELKINVGFEIDYLPGFENWTMDFLREYGKQIDDSILSLHFQMGNGGFRSIDFSAEDYEDGLVKHYGSFQKVQEKYFSDYLNMVESDLGNFKPKRMGHLTLCQKFQTYFKNENTELSTESLMLVDQILTRIVEKGYELDFNTAGLFKEYCGETYPPSNVMQLIRKKGVPFVYGSDSHAIKDLGRGYDAFLYEVTRR
ncbi:histidinol-phosphatase HisJ [Ureibacillus manganicus]|uniref:Histidinol-phosphatase n=1 Tax=Ureibacillus manganicus DSM 26584 TaxID=1384049 RepID=A0A0A3HZJ0_9BACL|nr:histidinol-phosphatase HisJ [Ureibacillus manganicus]KGR78016.1 histidinol phosphatase [Ureibacillus manganicus DSM 26584]